MVGVLRILTAGCCMLQAQTAYISKGDVFLRENGELEIQITRDGLSREAAVSPDGKLIAILRGPSPEALEVVVRDTRTRAPRTLASIGGRVEIGPFRLQPKGRAEWSPDSTSVYFLLGFSGTSNYLARLDISSGKVGGLGEVISYAVVRRGKYQGKLITLKRKHTLVRVWDWYWLVDESGSEIGPIGSRDDLVEFIGRFCDPSQKVP